MKSLYHDFVLSCKITKTKLCIWTHQYNPIQASGTGEHLTDICMWIYIAYTCNHRIFWALMTQQIWIFFLEAHDVNGNRILLSLSMINNFDLYDSLNCYRILEYNAYRLTKIEYTDAFHNVLKAHYYSPLCNKSYFQISYKSYK